MRWHALLLVLLLFRLAVAEPTTRLRLATVEEGRAILGRADEFTEQLSPFDRAARVQSGRAVDPQTFLQFAAAQVEEWNAAERTRLETASAALQSKLAKLHLPPVGEVLLIKSTGNEEGGAPYTRGNAIVLRGRLAEGSSLTRVLAHEYFHVMSRRHPELRDRLYALAGFEPCPPLNFPSDLSHRKITNPDAPFMKHCIRLGADGATYVPILFSKVDTYDEQKGGAFFAFLDFRLLKVAVSQGETRPLLENSHLVLLDPQVTPEYRRKTGENTHYVIHPEEVMADNFVLLLEGGKVTNRKLLDSLRDVLTNP